jgi:hypothetical protein
MGSSSADLNWPLRVRSMQRIDEIVVTQNKIKKDRQKENNTNNSPHNHKKKEEKINSHRLFTSF